MKKKPTPTTTNPKGTTTTNPKSTTNTNPKGTTNTNTTTKKQTKPSTTKPSTTKPSCSKPTTNPKPTANPKPTNNPKPTSTPIKQSSPETSETLRKILHEKLVQPLPSANHSNIVTNSNISSYLYLELYNHLNSKDDIKALAVCRLSNYI